MDIKKKIIYFFKGNLIAKLFGFFSFFILAKIIPLETFAIYTIYLFVAEVLLTTLTCGFNSYILRNSNEKHRLQIFPKAIFIILLSFFFFSLSLEIIEPLILNIFSETYKILWSYKYYILIILLNRSFIDMCLGYFISNHKAKSHMKVSIINSVSFFIVLLLNYNIFNLDKLDLIFYSLLISTSISLISSYLLIRENNFIQLIKFKEIFLLINESWPFMFKNIIGIFGIYLSRLILDSIATKEELAAYSFYLIIIFQLSFFSNILSQSIIPTLRDAFHKLDILNDKLNFYFKRYVFISLIVLTITIVISYLIYNNTLYIFAYIVREEYLEYIWLFPILLSAFLLGNLRVLYDVWQYHELMDVKIKLIMISATNVLLGIIVYPIGYKLFNVYGVAIGYLLIVSIYTYVSYYYFKDLKRRIKLEENIHNS